jgi:predicted ATP-grasp superfamily ATP-dependent carboligase
MSDLIELWERPAAGKYMIAGWRQWADAGAVSSALPQYLIDQTGARKIGQIRSDGFYLFQIPGTHHLLRPVVNLNEGHREAIEENRNEFYYAGDDKAGFLIFLGEEPHQDEQEYADAFFDIVEELGVQRVASVAGVYGAMPYDKNRDVSSVYSLPEMKDELEDYAVRFSNYEGGATISMYLAHRAARRGMQFFRFCVFVPSYDFSRGSVLAQRMAIEEDYKAWHDLMTRLNHMFHLNVDLSDLEERCHKLVSDWDAQIDELESKMPQLGVRAYLEKVNRDFTEVTFVPLSDVWAEQLGRLLDDF